MNSIETLDQSKRQILSSILLVAAGASMMSLTVNAINQRPLLNILFPGALCLILLGLYYLANHKSQLSVSIAKYAALMLLNVIYIPGAWLTSPGSTSAMPYYSIAIFIFGLVLTTRVWEYLFSGITLIEVLVMFQLEGNYPEWFDTYTDPVFRLFDLTINYLVASGVIFMMVFIILAHYQRHNKELYKMSILDSLTGLYNRRHMMLALEGEHNASLRTGIPYTIVLIDIDNFKLVNDTLGHLEGDSALRTLGAILLNESRSYDICCRYGGDEFLIILPRTGIEEAKTYIERMQQRFNDYVLPYKELNVSLSIGLCERKDHTLKEMIEMADNTLYKHKHHHSTTR